MIRRSNTTLEFIRESDKSDVIVYYRGKKLGKFYWSIHSKKWIYKEKEQKL